MAIAIGSMGDSSGRKMHFRWEFQRLITGGPFGDRVADSAASEIDPDKVAIDQDFRYRDDFLFGPKTI